MSDHLPFLRPSPPKLSTFVNELRRIEDSGRFTNFGPVNSELEAAFLNLLFDDEGACTTVCNATLGLMLAIKAVTNDRTDGRRYALMPSFTFAATAHAAIWAGFRPLFCDIEPDTWISSPSSEDALLRQFSDQIGVILPYATFGASLDLEHYSNLADCYGIPIVIDAAASLSTIGADGRGFGTGFEFPVVYSMHVTKAFSASEGGLVYCRNLETIKSIRTMANFGFSEPGIATTLGLNAKLSEVGALLGLLRLKDIFRIAEHRAAMHDLYKVSCPELTYQSATAPRQAHQFVPALVPTSSNRTADEVLATLNENGIGSASYFRPHLAESPFFQRHSCAGPLPVTADISRRILSLPLYDAMEKAEVDTICQALKCAMAR